MIKSAGNGWYVYYDKNGEEKLRFKPPEGGMSVMDIEAFEKHLLRTVVKDKPN